MTDHLEPYRRMAHSIRFIPPLSLAQSQQKSVAMPVTSVQGVDSWHSKTSFADAVKPDVGLPIDQAKHIATLVHEAVSKPTVLPTTYTIPENLGDRISRLTVHKPRDFAIIQPKIPQPDPNWVATHAVEVAATPTVEPVPAVETSAAPAIPPVAESVEVEATPTVEPVPVAESVEVEATPTAESVPVVETSAAPAIPPVAESVEVEATPTAEPLPVAETSAAQSVVQDVAEAHEPVIVTATTADPISETNTPVAEAEETQPPTILEKVSSVIEAVATAFQKPDKTQQESEAVVEPAQLDDAPTQTTIQDTDELLTTEASTEISIDEAEQAPSPSVLERVAAVVEAVVTPIKESVTGKNNLEATSESASAAPEKALATQTTEVICPACGATDIRKNGRRQGKQRYACKDCGRQFALPEVVEAEHQPKQQESTAVEVSSVQDSPLETSASVQDKADQSAKDSSKKKKAKGFGAGKKRK